MDRRLRDAQRALAHEGGVEASRRLTQAWVRAGEPGRDPRRDPVQGDVVRCRAVPGRRRAVARYIARVLTPRGRTQSESLVYWQTFDVEAGAPQGPTHSLMVGSWQKWAADAEVLLRVEE